MVAGRSRRCQTHGGCALARRVESPAPLHLCTVLRIRERGNLPRPMATSLRPEARLSHAFAGRAHHRRTNPNRTIALLALCERRAGMAITLPSGRPNRAVSLRGSGEVDASMAWLTVQEAANLLRVPVSWLYERTRTNSIPHVKLGKYLRFDHAELTAWLGELRRDGTGPETARRSTGSVSRPRSRIRSEPR